MGKNFTKMKLPLRDYNLENRVFKELDKNKPTPAPRHPLPERYQDIIEQQQQQGGGDAPPVPTAEMIRRMALEASDEELAEDPVSSELLRKNEPLLDRMDQLKITSQGDNPEIKPVGSRPMPESRKTHERSRYGHEIPEKISIGKMSMRHIVESLVDHSKDEELWSPAAISNSYRIDAEKAKHLTTYYRVFDVHLPKRAVEKYRNMEAEADFNKMIHKNRLIGDKDKES